MTEYKPPIVPICTVCLKFPHELAEYAEIAKKLGITPAEYVKRQEGTYNEENGHFVCTPCYIDIGMPTAPQGWKAP